MDRGAGYRLQGCKESNTTERLSTLINQRVTETQKYYVLDVSLPSWKRDQKHDKVSKTGQNHLSKAERVDQTTGFPCTSVGKESACNAGDPGQIPGLGRVPGEGNGNPLQYSGLESSTDRGVWQATVHGATRVGHDLATKQPPPPDKLKTRYPKAPRCVGHSLSSDIESQLISS